VHVPAMRLAPLALPVAGLAAVLAGTLAGCEPSTVTAAAAASVGASPSVTQTPLAAVKLAAQVTNGVSSFTGTMSLQVTGNSGVATGDTGDMTMASTFTEQVNPLLADVNIQSMSTGDTPLPGGVDEILTASTIYLKWSLLTQTLHLTRPWLAIGVSAMTKSTGVNFSQLFTEASSSGPLTESQLLAGATSVRRVAVTTIAGVPVTEYTGTIPMSQGASLLSGSAKTQLQQAITADGFRTATFTAWIDAQHMVRKAVVTEVGKTVTETTTTTITSVDKPAKVSVPPADQTAPLTGSDLG
jgi:hypothetical protein